MKKKIILLGATGSIGTQTLDVLTQHPDKYELVGISAGTQADKLKQILEEFPSVQAVSIQTEGTEGWPENVQVFEGENSLDKLLRNVDYDLLVNAVVGFAGLKPTLTSIELGKDIALANKESLVAGGPLVKEKLKEHNVRLYPIDSEHSAIWQCLQGSDPADVNRLIITASGGSFRDKTRDELTSVTVQQALQHPNWNMGKRITIDSATMINKGFEVIEAHYLFDIPFEKIETVLHPESIVHSMVEYNDHAVLAQLGSADMRLPIQYALWAPERPELSEEKPLDMTQTLDLHFKKMDTSRFPILKTAYEAGKKGGNAGAVLNGADEQAVSLFLEGKIGFLDIEQAIEHALKSVPFEQNVSWETLAKADRQARQAVLQAYEAGVFAH